MSTVTVASGVFSNYEGAEVTLKLRRYVHKKFIPTSGNIIMPGRVGTPNFYDTELTCTVSAGNVTYPQHTLDSTSDAISNPKKTYYDYALFTTSGQFVKTVAQKVKVPPSPSSTTLSALLVYSGQGVPIVADEAYTKGEINVLLAGLVSTAIKATTAALGVNKIFPAPTDADNPTAAGINHASLGGVIASYAKASLPAAKTGQMAHVTDSTGGIWRYDETLVHWIPSESGREINPLDFCNPVASSDCTAGIQAAIAVAHTMGGATIKFPAGYEFWIASPLDLTSKRNVRFVGTNTERWYPGTNNNIVYTGTGGTTAIDCRSSTGLGFDNMSIRYNNTGFTGKLIEFGHDGSGADAQSMRFRKCVLGGIEFSLAESANPAAAHADNASHILDLGFSIIGIVEECHFVYGNVGVLGESTAKGYSYCFSFKKNQFNYVPSQIVDPGSLWSIVDNISEPDLDGKVKFISNTGAFFSRGLRIQGNYLGDTTADNTVPMISIRALGALVSTNFITQNYNGVGLKINESNAVTIENNRFETLLTGAQVEANTNISLDGSVSANTAVGIKRNSLTGTTEIAFAGTNKVDIEDNYNGATPLENFRSNAIQVGNGTTGATDASTARATITIGEATTIATGKFGAAILRVQSAFLTIFRDGGLVFRSRSDSNNTETSFLNGTSLTPQCQMLPAVVKFSVPVGYQPIVAGVGGTVTQGTSKATTVVLSKVSGNITMHAATLAAGATVSFTLTNTLIEADDELNLRHASAGTRFAYDIDYACGSGSATIYVKNNTGGDLSEAIVLSFAILRRAIA